MNLVSGEIFKFKKLCYIVFFLICYNKINLIYDKRKK